MMHTQVENWLKGIDPGRNPDEYEAKQLARLFGIGVPDGIRLEKDERFRPECIQFPCALKVCSAEVTHKTEVQGVVLNNTKETIRQKVSQMRRRFPGERLLVETQCDFTGPEIIIGIVKDTSLGHAVMVGSGGIYTEIYNDTSFRLAPCSPADALDMIDELKISPVFDAFRGIKIDKQKLALTIVQVSRMAQALGDMLSQLDINPIVYDGAGWIALDIQIMLDSGTEKDGKRSCHD